MKEKLRLALVNKYKSLGYSQKAINVVLEYLEKSVKEETEIDEAVDGVGAMLKAFQSEINRIAAAEIAAKDKEKEDEKEEAAKKEKESSAGGSSENGKDKSKDSNEVPEWAKGLIESNKAQLEANKLLSDKLAAIESGKTSESRKQIFETKLKDFNPILKDVYIDNFDPSKFETDEAFQEYVTATEAKISQASQKLSDLGLGQSGRPFTPVGGGAGKEASKEEVDSIFGAL
ncbi:hypothetical protein [Dyadobacter sp. 3J3]|uniref:hypothetical protein n=1 Tax=Dyadobacter sp. 3J3 TaxID=2606600 RepID=UPI0013568A89|nr:hypothetical protein [Dyadobacter sp. 3J3]